MATGSLMVGSSSEVLMGRFGIRTALLGGSQGRVGSSRAWSSSWIDAISTKEE